MYTQVKGISDNKDQTNLHTSQAQLSNNRAQTNLHTSQAHLVINRAQTILHTKHIFPLKMLKPIYTQVKHTCQRGWN